MGAYLPKAVLDNFLKKASAIKTKDTVALQEIADATNFKKNELNQSNIGKQSLSSKLLY